MLRDGKITDETRRRIERDLDLEEASMANREYRKATVVKAVIARSVSFEAIQSFSAATFAGLHRSVLLGHALIPAPEWLHPPRSARIVAYPIYTV